MGTSTVATTVSKTIPDEVVGVVKPVVLDVERMAAKSSPMSEEHAAGPRCGNVHQGADGIGAVRMFTAWDSGTSAPPG